MSTLTVAEAREHFADLCTSVATTGEPVIIQREGQPNVMIVPVVPDRSAERAERLKGKPGYIEELRDAAGSEHTITTTFGELCRSVGVDARVLPVK